MSGKISKKIRCWSKQNQYLIQLAVRLKNSIRAQNANWYPRETVRNFWKSMPVNQSAQKLWDYNLFRTYRVACVFLDTNGQTNGTQFGE